MIARYLFMTAALIAACMIFPAPVQAETPWEGSPLAIQGAVMDVNKNTIIVAEKSIAVVDATVAGKKLKTVILDSNGNEIDKARLTRGTIIFAKCYKNDELQKDGFTAAEIHVIPHLLGAGDSKKYEKLMAP